MPPIILTLISASCYLALRTNADYYAKEGEFPYEVSVAYKEQHICGGAIISEYVVVTAAHCLKYLEAPDLAVFAGVHDFYIFPRGHQYKVNATHIHPKYKPASRDNDVALLKLKTGLPLQTAKVEMIKVSLINHSHYGGKLATVVYWEMHTGTRLLYAQVELWPEEKCTPANIFGDINATAVLPSQKYVNYCAGIPQGLCIGQDAGSLVLDNQLWGVVSLNIACDSKDKPLVFTNLAYYSEWIKDNE